MRQIKIALTACVFMTGSLLAQSGSRPESPTAKRREQPQRMEGDHNRSSAVPAALTSTGELAEDIYDSARARKWKTARRQMTQLEAAAQKVNAVQSRKAQLLRAVSTLESSVRTRDPFLVMDQANEITRMAAEMSASYHPVVPVQVALLDYYGRRLQVVSTRGDRDQMNYTSRKIVDTWRQVRPEVQQRNAHRVIASWDRLARTLQSAHSAAQFRQAAKNELDQVDKLEKVFETSRSAALRD